MGGLFPVMLGGAIGAAARYLAGLAVSGRLGYGFPWATLFVNLFGGLLMGLLAGAVARGSAGEGLRLLLGVGVLGGFTTFSAFSLESWHMIERAEWMPLACYIGASVVGSIAAVAIGLSIGRAAA